MSDTTGDRIANALRGLTCLICSAVTVRCAFNVWPNSGPKGNAHSGAIDDFCAVFPADRRFGGSDGKIFKNNTLF